MNYDIAPYHFSNCDTFEINGCDPQTSQLLVRYMMLHIDKQEACLLGYGRFKHFNPNVRGYAIPVEIADVEKVVNWLGDKNIRWSWEAIEHPVTRIQLAGVEHPYCLVMIYMDSVDDAALMKMSI